MPSFAVPATSTSPACRPTSRRRPTHRIPPDRPPVQAAGGLQVTLQAVPNADFPIGTHEREVTVAAHEVPVADIAEARQVVADFVTEHDLGGGNIPTACGVVRQGGVPIAIVSFNGRLWAVDSAGRETGEELGGGDLC